MHWLDWRRWLVYTHRWLGIAGGVLFVAWFVSGVVMMYARMPILEPGERLARAPVLDLSRAAVSPIEAARAVGIASDDVSALAELTRPATEATAQKLAAEISIERLRVGMLGDRPVYRFGARGNETIVYADTAEIAGPFGPAEAEAVARRFVPEYSGAIRYDGYLTGPDQWTLQARGLMPIHRFALDDPDASRLYVSSITGEVVLRTTRSERFWGYLGPVTHWVYFTPLRRRGSAWSEFVIWSSLIGCVMCLTGLIWGLWRYSPASRFRLKRVPSQSPYAGLMKWHHYTGLLFGVVTLTWTYSGLLSMEPFNWFSSPGITAEQRDAFRGGALRVELLTLDSLRASVAGLERGFGTGQGRGRGFVKELEATQFRGEPFWLAHRAPSAADAVHWMYGGLRPRAARPQLEHRYVSATDPAAGTFKRFDEPRFGGQSMLELARDAMPGVAIQDAVWLREYDAHYYDLRAGRPLPVLRVRYADEANTWLYVDPARGSIVQRTDDARRLRRWLYRGLHSLDFPVIYYRRPLWDIVVIVLSIGGLALSATTLLPAWRRVRRHMRHLGRLATIHARQPAPAYRRAFRQLLPVALLVASASCGRPDPADWTIAVQRVESPAGRDSSEPQLAISDDGVLLSWIERAGTTTTLRFSERTAAGWTRPVTAASGTDWFLSYADVPSVMRKTDGTLVAQWLRTTDARTEAYDLMLSYSNDNGKTWAPPFTPHHDGTTFQHGFASLVELPGNALGVVWLDGRNSEFRDEDPASGTMTLRYAAFDANWKQTADAEIDHNVCECCSTAAALTSDGIVAAFRDRSDKEIRDIAVSRLENGTWTPGALVHPDNWEIFACPVNGPALDARGRDAVVAWFTVENDQGQAYAAFSADAGRTWGAPVRLDEGGSLGRVGIKLMDDGTAVATWVEFARGRSEFRARLIDSAGARSAPMPIAGVNGGRASGFPRVARHGNELVFAWSASPAAETKDGSLQVYTAVAALP